MAERMRLSFEELGPTFVKLGQLLATRPDLVPQDFVNQFEKLQDRVQTLDFAVVEHVLKEEFGDNLYNIFESFDPKPLGSASIAQVHKALLKTGEVVVIKLQRPGILQTINDDLNVLYFLAELLETYVPETKVYSPLAIVDEYFKTLELETNFLVEANNIRRIQENFKNFDGLKIPQVYLEHSTEKVLVMEALSGAPLSQEIIPLSETDKEDIMKVALKVYLKMVFEDGLFHGDLHPGNVFVLADKKIGLIDFGVVGRLNKRTQSSIANMLMALAQEDYDRLAFEYADLAPFSEHVNLDLFAKDLQSLIAPYYGLSLKNMNFGELLLNSSSIASKHKLQLPADLMLYFKSIVCIEGVGRKISNDFDFLKYSLEFAKDLVQTQYDSTKMMADLYQVARESKSFLQTLPRQLHFFIRKINNPHHVIKHELAGFMKFKKTFEISVNLLFLGLLISSLTISSSLIYIHNVGPYIWNTPALSVVGYTFAMMLSFLAFFNYIRK